MSGDREPDRDVEFVDPDGGTDDADEVLDDRPRPATGRTPRRVRLPGGREVRIDLSVGAVVIVGGLLVAQAITNGHPEPTPGASGSASAPASASAAVVPRATASDAYSSTLTITLDPTTGRLEGPLLPTRVGINAAGARCPDGRSCSTRHTAAPDALAAIHAVFPTAHVTTASRVRLADGQDDPLWFSSITATVGRGTLLVRVEARGPDSADEGGARDDGSTTVTYVRTQLASYDVYAQLTARSGASEPFDALTTLTSDPRLLAPT